MNIFDPFKMIFEFHNPIINSKKNGVQYSKKFTVDESKIKKGIRDDDNAKKWILDYK